MCRQGQYIGMCKMSEQEHVFGFVNKHMHGTVDGKEGVCTFARATLIFNNTLNMQAQGLNLIQN